MKLVIVESPAKGKTIEKYLGPEYKVLASFGHVRDLPKKELGVDVERNFKPKYVIIPKAKKVISFLKKEAKEADSVILATDFDREGEAIAWHLLESLSPKSYHLNPKRITFSEITKEAIQNALKNPRDIDIKLVNAQQARRILDRLVGYKLSPFLWKKVAQGLSAGRVQSVAVRLVVEREREIKNFKPEEYWRIVATLLKPKTKEFDAVLIKKDDKPIGKLSIKTKADADKMLDDLKGAEYKVKKIERGEKNIYPYPPFITSTLQQEAFRKFGFSAKKTMFLAQQLYEKGLISYHRTDSTNLSQLALNSIRKYIKQNFGEKYLPEKARFYKTKVLKAQEAHEAIRPTYIKISNLKSQISNLTEDHQKLYDLIWRRTLACQMKEAILDTQKVEIDAQNYTFLAEGQKIKFDGFLKVYPLSIQEIDLPLLSINEILKLIKLNKEQHFTQPPKRYTEATLIKELEKEGIGRPSTYAPILSTIQERGYVGKNGPYLFPKEIGFIVNDLLVKHFPSIVDLKFTASMEEELDEIAEGRKKYEQVCQDFWLPFSKTLSQKEKEIDKKEITEEETNEVCEKCGSKMVVKLGRYGKFLSCSNFPACKNTRPFIKLTGTKCPKCKKGEVVERINKKGQIFYGCSRYPECDYTSGEKPRVKSEILNPKH
jgi:DNA topoisomerase-1